MLIIATLLVDPADKNVIGCTSGSKVSEIDHCGSNGISEGTDLYQGTVGAKFVLLSIWFVIGAWNAIILIYVAAWQCPI